LTYDGAEGVATVLEGVWLAIVTGALGLLTAGILALVNSWISARVGVDETLRRQRLELYPPLWSATAAVPRWPRVEITRTALEDLHRTLRSWYFNQGGLFLSDSARARYGDVQELIAALLAPGGDPADVLGSRRYEDLMETISALRTALAADLDTRRRKSFWEVWRRRQWHKSAAEKAQRRISRAGDAAPAFLTGDIAGGGKKPPLPISNI
jgi:hypothetical protein